MEIYQNCNVFNDGAFEIFTEKDSKKQETIFVEHNQPLVFGNEQQWGIRLDGFKPEVVSMNDFSHDDLWIHDEKDPIKAHILSRIFDDPQHQHHLPRPFGVLYAKERPVYEDGMNAQVEQAIEKWGTGDLDKLIAGKETWTIN